MLVKSNTGKYHFIKDGMTLCGREIKDNWSEVTVSIFDTEDFCKRCLKLSEEDFVNLDELLGEDDVGVIPAKGFKI